jgi:hypothetical protein
MDLLLILEVLCSLCVNGRNELVRLLPIVEP